MKLETRQSLCAKPFVNSVRFTGIKNSGTVMNNYC